MMSVRTALVKNLSGSLAVKKFAGYRTNKGLERYLINEGYKVLKIWGKNMDIKDVLKKYVLKWESMQEKS